MSGYKDLGMLRSRMLKIVQQENHSLSAKKYILLLFRSFGLVQGSFSSTKANFDFIFGIKKFDSQEFFIQTEVHIKNQNVIQSLLSTFNNIGKRNVRLMPIYSFFPLNLFETPYCKTPVPFPSK